MFSPPDKLKARQGEALQQICHAHPDLERLYQFIRRFLDVFHAQSLEQLVQWIRDVFASSLKPLHTFATGLERDRAAVRASVTSLWSNGQTEGHIQRLKLLTHRVVCDQTSNVWSGRITWGAFNKRATRGNFSRLYRADALTRVREWKRRYLALTLS